MRYLPVWSIVCLLCGIAHSVQAQEDAERRAELRKYALEHRGDAAHGAELFRQREKLACSNCHEIVGPEKSGPNLDGIADFYPRTELIKHILEPSASIKPGYEQVTVVTEDGKIVTGRVRVNSRLEYKLIDSAGKTISIKQEDIQEVKPSLISMMPENLIGAVSPNEFCDLIAYLETLHSSVLDGLIGPEQPVKVPQLKQAIGFQPIHPSHMRFANPVWMLSLPAHAKQFLVLEQQEGKIWRLNLETPMPTKELFLDIKDQIAISSNQGLMCLAFHPQFQRNGKYYLKHEIQERGRVVTTVVERLANEHRTMDSGTTSRRLLSLEQPAHNNTGGCMMFGADGMLYIAFGDGGPSYDRPGHGQNLGTMQGAILRIDVDRADEGKEYAIPKDNPFWEAHAKGKKVHPEIWAYGFREPWRFSFDRLTHDLWVGDVGQDKFEEVAIVRRGENHGWNVLEGFANYSDEYRRAGEQYTSPLFAYPRSFGIAVVGGYVYRGDPASTFYGAYIFGDYETRRVWALKQENGKVTMIREIGRAPEHIASFSEGSRGELYCIGYEGNVYELQFAASRMQ